MSPTSATSACRSRAKPLRRAAGAAPDTAFVAAGARRVNAMLKFEVFPIVPKLQTFAGYRIAGWRRRPRTTTPAPCGSTRVGAGCHLAAAVLVGAHRAAPVGVAPAPESLG